ncbi:hypothetical protein GOV08_02270 [Candidatus Woesearchaeota archaeon]|nr:hypothetical protein [Candidatus Woesearchaeota archaeon]
MSKIQRLLKKFSSTATNLSRDISNSNRYEKELLEKIREEIEVVSSKEGPILIEWKKTVGGTMSKIEGTKNFDPATINVSEEELEELKRIESNISKLKNLNRALVNNAKNQEHYLLRSVQYSKMIIENYQIIRQNFMNVNTNSLYLMQNTIINMINITYERIQLSEYIENQRKEKKNHLHEYINLLVEIEKYQELIKRATKKEIKMIKRDKHTIEDMPRAA